MRTIFVLLCICILSCYSKKSKIFHKSKNVSVKSDIKSAKVSKDVAKKQYLGVPASPASQREGLGGEPVGDLNAEGGLGGLGGDMGGIPTGMGAGAEPLGAFENNNEGQQQAPENEGAPNQGVEEEGQQPIAAFNKAEKPNEGEQGNPEMFHDEVGNGPGVRPMDKEEMNDGPPGLNQGMNINAPQPDMTESMTNNIAAMDKANIQGDSEVAEMVRQYAKGKDSFNTSPYEPQIPQRPEAQFSKANRFQPRVEEERPIHNFEDNKEESFWERNGDVKFENFPGNHFPEGNFESMNNLEKALDKEMMLDKGIEARATAAMRREHDDFANFNNFDDSTAKMNKQQQKIENLELSKIKNGGEGLSNLLENDEMFRKANRYSEKFLDNGNSIDAKAIEEGNSFDMKSPPLKSSFGGRKPNILQNDMFNEIQRLRGGGLTGMEAAAMTQGSSLLREATNLNILNNEGNENLVMEPTTVFGMNNGIVRGPLPGSSGASFLPENYEMTAIDPKILDMQQLALEKRKKVLFSNDTTHGHAKLVDRFSATVNTTNHTKTLFANKQKPKVELQNIQRTSLKKDIDVGFIKLKDLPPAGQRPPRYKHFKTVRKVKPKSKQSAVIKIKG